jgi:hypothetical protein
MGKLDKAGTKKFAAMAYASVAASFTIEQWGLPNLADKSLWNGSQPQERLKSYQSF